MYDVYDILYINETVRLQQYDEKLCSTLERETEPKIS